MVPLIREVRYHSCNLFNLLKNPNIFLKRGQRSFKGGTLDKEVNIPYTRNESHKRHKGGMQ